MELLYCVDRNIKSSAVTKVYGACTWCVVSETQKKLSFYYLNRILNKAKITFGLHCTSIYDPSTVTLHSELSRNIFEKHTFFAISLAHSMRKLCVGHMACHKIEIDQMRKHYRNALESNYIFSASHIFRCFFFLPYSSFNSLLWRTVHAYFLDICMETMGILTCESITPWI